MTKHLAIFVGNYIEKILSGEKTVEGRFSIDRILPYGIVKKGDIIFLKQSGGMIIGEFEVDNVLYYEGLNAEAIGKIRREYNQELCTEDGFWQVKANSHYVSLIFIKNPKKYLAPLRSKKHDRRGWVVLEK
ncbi:MAG: hypothetical protein ACD_58C00273G0005 [uncultured bacterium]|nr:MAG: hypothetical protein ACD_58C00273G0005 [uncultured bacterium]